MTNSSIHAFRSLLPPRSAAIHWPSNQSAVQVTSVDLDLGDWLPILTTLMEHLLRRLPVDQRLMVLTHLVRIHEEVIE